MRHQLDPAARHSSWDRALTPALTVASGDEVEICIGDPQPERAPHDPVPPASMPLSGPIALEGAMPGDVVEIAILEVRPASRGYTTADSRFGLLGDLIDEPYRHEWVLDGSGWAEFKPGIRIPVRPFLGLIGLAPAAFEPSSALPPGLHGGNLDIKHLVAGSTLWLPAFVPGGRLSAGDMHAAQGDGEVCGTAIETWGTATLRLTLRRDMRLRAPQFRTPGPLEPPELKGQWHGTTGIGPDLMQACRDALRDMIDFLVLSHDLTKAEAYALASVAADLRIAEIVDRPNWVVTACLPLAIFDRITIAS